MLNLFQPPAGLLGDQEEAIRQQMQTQGLLGLAAGLFQAGTPSRQRQSLGGSALQGLMAGQQMAQGTFDQALKSMQLRQQMAEREKTATQEQQQRAALESYIANLPPEQQAQFRAFPAQAAEAMFREPKAAPGVVGEFQAAKKAGIIAPETTLPEYIELKKPPAPTATATATTGGGLDLTPGQKKIDETFATDYVTWRGGGGQDMTAQIAQLKPVIEALEAGQPITGMRVAVQPDLMLAITNPQALQSREQVEEVVQRNLRAVLGAQFTEKEGERLIARAYNPKLPPEENAKRLRRLFLQMSTAAEQKQAMVDYFDQNGTLRGFTGRMPSVQDFYKAMEGDSDKERVLRFNPKTGRVE